MKCCGKMREDKITSPSGLPRDNPCLSFPAKPACNTLPLSRRKSSRGWGSTLGSASGEKTGDAKPRASPALIAGADQGPALGLGSAQQLNQQIISSIQSRRISILLLSSRPVQLNPFICVSPKPQSFGVSWGEMLLWGRRRWGGAQGAAFSVPLPERRPRRSSSQGAGARLGASRQSRTWRLVCSPPGSPMTALPFTTSCKNLAADLGELPGPKM